MYCKKKEFKAYSMQARMDVSMLTFKYSMLRKRSFLAVTFQHLTYFFASEPIVSISIAFLLDWIYCTFSSCFVFLSIHMYCILSPVDCAIGTGDFYLKFVL
jgi:hypothetical protein